MERPRFRDKVGSSDIEDFLRANRYVPIFQSAWSTLYVAKDWRDYAHTGAYRSPENGYMSENAV